MAWTYMATSENRPLVFIDDVTDDGQPNSAKLIGQCFTVQLDSEPKHTVDVQLRTSEK